MTVWNVVGPAWVLLTIYVSVVWVSQTARLAFFMRLRPPWLHLVMLLSIPLVVVTWPLLLPVSMLPRFRDRTHGAIGFERMWRLTGEFLGFSRDFRRAGRRLIFMPPTGPAAENPDPLINPHRP